MVLSIQTPACIHIWLMVYNTFGKLSFAMPQMKTSNMLDNYNIKDIHLRNGRDMLDIYRERAQCQAFYCSHTTGQRRWWLLLLGLAELKDQLSYQSLIPLLVVVAAEDKLSAGVRKGDRDQGAVLLCLPRCFSRQQLLFCLCLYLYLILL